MGAFVGARGGPVIGPSVAAAISQALSLPGPAPTDDPDYVMIDLDFDDASEAQAYLAALQCAV